MNIKDFLKESNAIENIHREPTQHEVYMTDAFLASKLVTTKKLCALVDVYQLGAKLRIAPGMNVSIGGRMCPYGGPGVGYVLDELLDTINDGKLTPYEAHIYYERLHPFTDGNGRTGRALWLWMMEREANQSVAPLGFLQTIYYQMLSETK